MNEKIKNKEKIKNPINWKKRWYTILLFELLGTFLLVLWILIPSAMAFTSPSAHNNHQKFWEGFSKIWQPIFMKAFWVVFFIVVIVFAQRSISVNLNPIVTVAEIAKKNDTVSLGMMKITIQFFGGIIAGLVALDISQAMGIFSGNGSSLDAVKPHFLHYDWKDKIDGSWTTVKGIEQMKAAGLFAILSLFLEFAFSFVLLGSIFYFNIKEWFRPLFIGIVLWITLCFGIRTNNIALNPARLLGPALAHGIGNSVYSAGDTNNYLLWVPFYMSGQFLAAALFWGIERNKSN